MRGSASRSCDGSASRASFLPRLPRPLPSHMCAAFFVQMECGGGGIPDSNLPDDAFLGASDDTRGMYCFSVYISVYFAVRLCLLLACFLPCCWLASLLWGCASRLPGFLFSVALFDCAPCHGRPEGSGSGSRLRVAVQQPNALGPLQQLPPPERPLTPSAATRYAMDAGRHHSELPHFRLSECAMQVDICLNFLTGWVVLCLCLCFGGRAAVFLSVCSCCRLPNNIG